MVKSQKRVFLYALILTFVIFNLGIFFGYMLETSRGNTINNLYSDAELELLDQIAQKQAIGTLNFNCTTLTDENIKFGDQIFSEALQIKKYEDANRITSSIIMQHKRFDLLRTIFWINSIQIKQQCNSSYHDVIYLYKYNNPTVEQDAKQKFFSNMLQDLKQKQGSNIMLIPIAADNDIPSLNLLMDKYQIDQNNLPVILIDEKTKITDVQSIDDIEKYLN
ncbi:MAG TPA: hypothetical protein VMC80_00780 [Patescibacteria group bacterium]|nr:hypothetical protein [Patescibacteria group bacterium]